VAPNRVSTSKLSYFRQMCWLRWRVWEVFDMSRLVIFIVSLRGVLILLFSLYLIDQHSWRDGDVHIYVCQFFATSKLQESLQKVVFVTLLQAWHGTLRH
jgi:hypothetical protein